MTTESDDTPRGTRRNTPRDDLTAEFVRSILDYDPETGVLRWKVKRRYGCEAGTIAGSKDASGRVKTTIRRRSFPATHLIWVIVYGCWPENQIDHINGDPSDTRLVNLRDVTGSENMHNLKRARRDNVLGVLGVCRFRGKYRAQIRVDGRTLFIGDFDTMEQARAHYVLHKRILHPGWVEEEDIDNDKQ